MLLRTLTLPRPFVLARPCTASPAVALAVALAVAGGACASASGADDSNVATSSNTAGTTGNPGGAGGGTGATSGATGNGGSATAGDTASATGSASNGNATATATGTTGGTVTTTAGTTATAGSTATTTSGPSTSGTSTTGATAGATTGTAGATTGTSSGTTNGNATVSTGSSTSGARGSTGTGARDGGGTTTTTGATSAGTTGSRDGGTSSTTTGSTATGSTTTSGSTAAGDAGSSACSGSAADPAAATTVGSYMDKLPYNNPTGTKRASIIDAIIKSCAEFGPPASTANWKREYCWAHMVSAIEKESSYNDTLNDTVMSPGRDPYSTRMISVNGTMVAANDPTIGLTQIRFSSTVHDYAVQGPADRLACIGCTFPASFASHKNDAGGGNSDFWAVTGPTQNLSVMTSIPCNVGLGAWYYYTNATGNGNPSTATYLYQYCQGSGRAANLVTGLRSHLEGPDGGKGVVADQAGLNMLQTTDSSGYMYVTQIKTWFDSMIGTVSGTHPFFVTLSPNVSQYCTP